MSVEQAGGILFALLALAGAVVVALLVYEAWTLMTERAPITWFVRLGIADHPRFAFVFAFALGLLAGHFFWN